MKIFVTGAAGFIGMHVARRLAQSGHSVIGIDNINDYYDPALKQARLKILSEVSNFSFQQMDLADLPALKITFEKNKFDVVVNLAAQAGVRYSLVNPHAYVQSNLVGFTNVLECCRHFKIGHFIYASSSSVYGSNAKIPFSEHDPVDHPISLYAATKRSNELMAHSYSHLFSLPTTGLRFFTVYGPWGRPDMAPMSFLKAILDGKTIEVFNHGKMKRDFTFVDDIVEGVVRLVDHAPVANPKFDRAAPDPSSSDVPYRIYNIGNNKPIELLKFIATLESALGKKAVLKMTDMPATEVLETYADISELNQAVGFTPRTDLAVGIERLVTWYRDFYSC